MIGAGPGARELLRPTLSHDGLSFEELSRSYNFENVSARGLLLTRLIMEALEGVAEPSVLDVGCGTGIELRVDYQWAVRGRVSEYWGVEPDPGIGTPSGLFDTYLNGMVEEVPLPEDRFDLAYSFMVMEHVADPLKFLSAIHRCLKPGGTYLFATPNGRHYFTRLASLLGTLHLDEMVLRLARKESDEYHYPVHYRFNSEGRIREVAERLGFTVPEFAYTEDRGVGDYFPGPLRFAYHALRAKRRVIRRPSSLITMICRLGKPDG